jgi:hypothetical protein
MIFRKALSLSERNEIATSRVRTFDKYNTGLLIYYDLTSNDLLAGTAAEMNFYSLTESKTPSWTSTANIFLPFTNFNYMSNCPHGYRMHADYSDSSKMYGFCVERGSLIMLNGAVQTFNMQPLKVRYAMSYL